MTSRFTDGLAHGFDPATSVGRERWRVVGLLLSAVLVAALLAVSSAKAEFRITGFKADSLSAYGSPTQLDTSAGARPFASVLSMTFGTMTSGGTEYPDGSPRQLIVDLPKGFLGDPDAMPVCEPTALASGTCSASTQVGLITLRGFDFFGTPTAGTRSLFNVRPMKGAAAAFGFLESGVPVVITARVRPDGEAIQAVSSDISQALAVTGIDFILWGDPANPIHDVQRGTQYFCIGGFDDPDCTDPGLAAGWNGGSSAGVARQPFLANPSYCGDSPVTSVRARSWQDPDRWVEAAYTSQTPTDCDRLVFEPTVRPEFESTRAETPTGLRFGLDVPQSTELPGVATPTLRRAVVTLPAGISLNPSISDGLEGCTDAQIGLRTTIPIGCPAASNIGSVTITSPLLAERLNGPIYLGQPVPGKTYRIFLAAENPLYGISIRLEGVLHLDPVTGQITTVFEDNPQLPFSNFELKFRGGSRAPLATPQSCSSGSVTSQLTPWSDPNVLPSTPSSNINISWDGNGAACPAPGFAPSFKSGGTTPQAGADTKFTLTFGREDRERYLKDTSVTLPKGLLARIGSVPLCADGQAAAGTCDASSQIGTTTVGSGAGPLPFFLGGRVFITGPYKGAPYGMSIVVPAKAGPFDLGTVVVRAAIFVDRSTAQLRVVSDELPHILEGIPLRMRKVNVTIDRDKFMINPTNCSPSSVAASIGSIGGAAAAVASKFQIVNCKDLPFRPKMTIKAGAKGKLTRGKRTPLEVTLAMPLGQANNRSVRVTLPLSLNARLDVVNKRRACTEGQFAADKCPMKVGDAVAVTPLLRDPLKGPAYFVYTPARRLPDLVVRLRGPIAIDLVGKVTIARDLRLVTTFDAVPDAPITKFRLALASGSTNGPIGIVRNLCSTTTRRGLKAGLSYVAQSGETLSKQQQISVVGCGRTARRGSRRSARRSGR